MKVFTSLSARKLQIYDSSLRTYHLTLSKYNTRKASYIKCYLKLLAEMTWNENYVLRTDWIAIV